MVAVRRALTALLACKLALATAWAQGAEPQPVRFDTEDGTPLIGWLFLPEGRAAKGTVVALHGCSGLYATTGARRGRLAARHQALGEMLAKEGYAVLLPDSLTSRGVGQGCAQKEGQRPLGPRERSGDAQAALQWAASQTWAGAGKAVVLGWSQGGSAALALAQSGAAAGTGSGAAAPRRPAMAIALYPFCAPAPKGGYQFDIPLALLLAGKDERASPKPCVALAEAAGADVQVYAEAGHAFDDPAGDERFRLDVPGSSHPVRGALAQGNAAAREQAYAHLRELLGKALP